MHSNQNGLAGFVSVFILAGVMPRKAGEIGLARL
jgi:hypothetical protein